MLKVDINKRFEHDVVMTQCPLCMEDLTFCENSSPVLCPECFQLLPKYDDLIQDVDIRIDMYINGVDYIC